ncbi:hypothetical protein TanjilG_23336 [Lupinus angustifolius]|uniref:PHD-type domain-containing protein n=1 Tax=Lupinus angustifolius TaxID=3871 RepID=A0A4P1R9W9_LUPAN|nr:hypothetical protein TanjilG_23336 [Lupinus angustifolius]
MAFHVACPITCRRICFCALGFPTSLHNNAFLNHVTALRQFLAADTPTNIDTVQVAVPKVLPPPPPPPNLPPDGAPPCADALDESASMKAKRVALQRKGAAAMLAAEEFARQLESGAGDFADTSGNINGEEPAQSNVKVFCRMCNRVENDGSETAKKMLSCKSCSKKYHRNCLRSWAHNRVHGPVALAEFVRLNSVLPSGASEVTMSLIMCFAVSMPCDFKYVARLHSYVYGIRWGACRRTGDPSKFMFCKRCDGAYHCYCLQPPHKNVSTGLYLCPKHTRCHSCGSNVPGNGLSVRWFLGYTCCDACGRLFVKGNYCPVCLKVYRDSESTPMVCCDVCQRWVHIHCDNISDEKYHQFQVDGNLQYKCPTCRGECHQVQGLDEAVQELWRRRNIDDRDLIASLRAAAGLPTQDEIFSISPFSDDEDIGKPLKLKSDSGRSYKFSLKNLSNHTPKKKDYGKKSSSKKTAKKKDSQSFVSGKIDTRRSCEGHSDTRSLHSLDDDDIQSLRNDGHDVYSSPAEISCPTNQPGVSKHKFVDEVMVSDEERKPRVVRIKGNKTHIMNGKEESEKHDDKTQNVKGKKLVINLGARKINVASSPCSDTSSCQRDQDLVNVNGNEYISQLRKGDKFALDRQGAAARHIDGKGTSDEKYHQFQVDGNLQYKCPTCRGECHQVQGLDEAVQELWRRRNIDDRDLIASLRAAAGLPTQDEIFSISPFSDDEDIGKPLKLKSDSGRSYKFSLKNLSNHTPKKKDYGKKSSSKKTAKKKDSQSFVSGKIDTRRSCEGHSDTRSLHSLDDDDIQSLRNDGHDVYSSPAEISCPTNQPGVSKHKFVDEVMVSDEERKPRVVRIKGNKTHIMNGKEESEKHDDKTQNVKGKKLVINLGARKINVASSPCSDTSSCQRDQDLVNVNGNEYISQLRKGDKFALDRQGAAARHIDGKGNRVDFGQAKFLGRGNISDGSLERTHALRSKYSTDGIFDQVGTVKATSRGEGKYGERDGNNHNNNNLAPSQYLPKDSKPLLRFKLKKPSLESLNSPHQEEEKTIIKGQRSKRKRPTPFKEKMLFNETENVSQSHQDSQMDEIMAANWILMKLGNDAIGKRVEVHQTSDNSWHKGVVSDTVEGTSKIHVTLDGGKVKMLELRNQGVRFIPQKQKRSKT